MSSGKRFDVGKVIELVIVVAVLGGTMSHRSHLTLQNFARGIASGG